MLKFIQGKKHPNLRGCHCLDIHDKPIQHIKALPLTHSNKIILESSQNFAAANLFFFPFFLQEVIFWSAISSLVCELSLGIWNLAISDLTVHPCTEYSGKLLTQLCQY